MPLARNEKGDHVNKTVNAFRRQPAEPTHTSSLTHGHRIHLPLLVLVGMLLIPLHAGPWAAEKKLSTPV